MPSKTTFAIIGIVILEAIALFKGTDGAILATALTFIGGLGGYAAANRKKR